MMRVMCTALLCASLAACQSASDTSAADPAMQVSEDAISFVVIGDTPYSDADQRMLDEALPMIKEGAYPFIIHIGDYKGGRAACLPEYDEAQQKLLDNLSPTPVFFTPGDNEWTDCDRNENPETGKLYSDLQRLDLLRSMFFQNGNRPASLGAEYQASLPENATWTHKSVRFSTLHVTGTNNARDWVTGDPLEAALEAVTQRDAANLEWLTRTFETAIAEQADAVVLAYHGDMNDISDKPEDLMCDTVAESSDHACDGFTNYRAAIRDLALDFGKPVLMIHGDTAPFTLDQFFSGEEADNLWRLNAAGDTGPGYGTRDVTLVSIDVSDAMPFTAKGLVTDKFPKID